MKSHPHPERLDRLRAIAASLATGGVFPRRCYPILAREIKPEELQLDWISEALCIQVEFCEYFAITRKSSTRNEQQKFRLDLTEYGPEFSSCLCSKFCESFTEQSGTRDSSWISPLFYPR